MRFAQIQNPNVSLVYVNLQESDYLLKYTDKRVFKRDLNEHEQWIADGLVKKDILKRVKVEGKIAYIRNFKLDESQIQVSLYKDILNEGWKEKAMGALAAAGIAAGGATAVKQNTPQPDLQTKTQVAQTIEQDPYEKEFGDVNALKNMIKQHEGKRLNVYKDTVGKDTIGYGHLVKPGEDFSKGITDEEADKLFDKDFEHHVQGARTTPGYDLADQRRKQAMVDLAYNMGPNWHKKFPKFSAAAASGDWKTAAKELQNSKWYTQVGNRGKTIVNMMSGQ